MKNKSNFSVNDAFKVLKSVSQKDLWATRVSFVYSTEKNKVYYVLNNDFSNVFEFQFFYEIATFSFPLFKLPFIVFSYPHYNILISALQ